VLPAGVIRGIFSIGAMLFALYLSFHNWLVNDPEVPFVGLQNYPFTLADRVFLRSILNTFEYAALHGAGGWSQCLAELLVDHAAAAQADDVLCHRHGNDLLAPGVYRAIHSKAAFGRNQKKNQKVMWR